MILLRRIFFFLFTVIFLVVSPLIVMYSLGYLFKTGDVTKLVKTGLIYVDTFPKEARVRLAHSKETYKTPATIRDLMPGDYEIIIEAEGYQPWTKTLRVTSGTATVYDKIFLFAQSNQAEPISTKPIRELIPGSSGQYFITSDGRNLTDYSIYDLKAETFTPIFQNARFSASKAKVVYIHRVMNSDYLLIEAEEKNIPRYYWTQTKALENIKDVSILFYEKPSRITWDPSDENYLFAYYDDRRLSRADVKAMEVVPQLKTGIDGFGFFKNHLYMLRDNRMIKADLDGKTQQVLEEDRAFISSLFTPGQFVKIAVLKKNLILFLQADGRLVSNRVPYQFVAAGVQGFEYHSRKKRILIWTAQKIGVLDLTEPEESEVFQKLPAVKWIYEEGRDIKQAFWVYQGSHVLFKDGPRIILLQLFDHDRFTQNLAEAEDASNMAYSEISGAVYYIHAKDSRPYKLQIIPASELQLISIPEFDMRTAEHFEEK